MAITVLAVIIDMYVSKREHEHFANSLPAQLAFQSRGRTKSGGYKYSLICTDDQGNPVDPQYHPDLFEKGGPCRSTAVDETGVPTCKYINKYMKDSGKNPTQYCKYSVSLDGKSQYCKASKGKCVNDDPLPPPITSKHVIHKHQHQHQHQHKHHHVHKHSNEAGEQHYGGNVTNNSCIGPNGNEVSCQYINWYNQCVKMTKDKKKYPHGVATEPDGAPTGCTDSSGWLYSCAQTPDDCKIPLTETTQQPKNKYQGAGYGCYGKDYSSPFIAPMSKPNNNGHVCKYPPQ